MRLLAFGFTSGVVLFLAGSAIAGFFLWQAARDLPDYDVLSKYEPPVMTRIHAHDGALEAWDASSDQPLFGGPGHHGA